MYLSEIVKRGYELVAEGCVKAGMDIDAIKERIKRFYIETPSWGYADSGTRFGVFKQKNSAATLYEKIDDASFVNKITGVTPSVALHIPWDMAENWDEVKVYAGEKGVRIGAINPNLFQDDKYRYGSLTSRNEKIRGEALEHLLECLDIMRKTDSKIMSLWLSDGTNYPGSDSFRERHNRMIKTLCEFEKKMDADMKILIEYKFFEPAFYHTDIPDWGTASLMSGKIGEKAKVLVDLGHHPLGANIEFIVSLLINEGLLGGFHFNDKKYADDDLTSGSIMPYQLFLILKEISDYESETAGDLQIAYMVDQSHNLKHKIVAMVQTVENIQIAFAKSLLVDRKALKEAQANLDIVRSEQIVKDAFLTDVRPLLGKVREEMGLNPDIISACINDGYLKEIEKRGEK